MKNASLLLFLPLWAAFLLLQGCHLEPDSPDLPSNGDTSGIEPDSETSSEHPGCVELSGVDFGDCDISLGSGVINGYCVTVITGCDDRGHVLYADQDECNAACVTSEDRCKETGGHWDIASRGGHYVCGQPPVCVTGPICSDANIAGCDCGIHRKWDDELGCVADDSCVAPTCDDLVDVDFRYGDCISSVGWAVRDGSCQEIKGCSDLSYGFFGSQDECNAACITPQRLCMESGGAWMGKDALYMSRSDIYYQCGVRLSDPAPTLAPCNCGASKNYVTGTGCVDDPSCPDVQTTCPDFNFGDPSDYTASCATIPLSGHYGLTNGQCAIIFGCLDDFEGPGSFVDPDKWFSSPKACEQACLPRCTSDADCPDLDTDDEMGRYCHFDNDSNCGLLSNGGICTDSGGVCGGGYDPVCGCDGNYVSNVACIGVAGRPMRHEGLCFEFPPLL